ncbi:MAG: DUF2764 domain-containing protein [Tannerella sp.]|jgi:hypothetical protein|nr:DUF2764 domain-containing protein [Tannerella sp.]
MSKYYYLISGLPDIALDNTKQIYSISSFRHEIEGALSGHDRDLLLPFFRKFDNQNLLAFLKLKNQPFDERATVDADDIAELYAALRDEEKLPESKHIPPYFPLFVKEYLASEEKDDNPLISWEDRLSALYYDYAIKSPNRFISEWFELSLNIGNILTAINCRNHKLDKTEYIVGDNEVAESLRTSNARDFGLGETLDYLPELFRIVDEPNLMTRERKTDLLKWIWLDEQTFFKTFDIETIFAYLLRIEMIERWTSLDKTKGEQTFRELVGAVKRESAGVLDEFKQNTKMM